MYQESRWVNHIFTHVHFWIFQHTFEITEAITVASTLHERNEFTFVTYIATREGLLTSELKHFLNHKALHTSKGAFVYYHLWLLRLGNYLHPSILVSERKAYQQLSSWGIIINRFLSLKKDMTVSLEVPDSFNILSALTHVFLSYMYKKEIQAY